MSYIDNTVRTEKHLDIEFEVEASLHIEKEEKLAGFDDNSDFEEVVTDLDDAFS